MGFKIKNSLTGEFEKLPILTLKGEKGETGGVEEYNKVDYMGNKYETLKQANDANVEYAVKTAIGEFNYLDYDGQHITATDSLAGRAKNAILKGQTLVNLVGSIKANDGVVLSSDSTKEVIKATASGSSWNQINVKLIHLKPNTNYIVMFDKVVGEFENGYATAYDGKGGLSGVGPLPHTSENNYSTSNFFVVRTRENNTADNVSFRFHLNGTDTNVGRELSIEIHGLKIMEYQEGMENWDIPYFEGMQSVKMPVLTTVGKNLFDISYYGDVNNLKNTVEAYVSYKKLLKLEPNTRYRILSDSCVLPARMWSVFGIDDKNSNRLITVYNYSRWELETEKDYGAKNSVFTTPTDGLVNFVCYSRYQDPETLLESFDNRAMFTSVMDNIRIVKDGDNTTYEPYQSNILTVNEEVELRGMGDVQDTLDCLTGEVTERIGEIVLDGSENGWSKSGGNTNESRYAMSLKIENVKLGAKTVNDRFISGDMSNTDILNYVYGISSYNGIVIAIDNNKLETIDSSGFKKWLSQNPITVHYELAQESVKTVDLSDNHVYSYKGTTHYDCSSAEGSLVPTLFVKVPTDVQATIAQQRETIQTLNSENERLNQIQEALKASMLDSQVQLMNISWNTDFEVFTLRESIAPKDSLMDSRVESNIDKFSQAKFIIENDCPDLEKLNSQIEYYFSKDVFSQEQFEELTDLISIVKGENGCEY